MPKTSDVQWPESSSEDDFASPKSAKKISKKVSLATSARKRNQTRATNAKGPILTDKIGEDLDIVATIGAS
jgi:hypothetical protein